MGLKTSMNNKKFVTFHEEGNTYMINLSHCCEVVALNDNKIRWQLVNGHIGEVTFSNKENREQALKLLIDELSSQEFHTMGDSMMVNGRGLKLEGNTAVAEAIRHIKMKTAMMSNQKLGGNSKSNHSF